MNPNDVTISTSWRVGTARRSRATDPPLIEESLACGTRCLLRGADAIYAATAVLTGTMLITWDSELLERAGGATPTDWLSRQR